MRKQPIKTYWIFWWTTRQCTCWTRTNSANVGSLYRHIGCPIWNSEPTERGKWCKSKHSMQLYWLSQIQTNNSLKQPKTLSQKVGKKEKDKRHAPKWCHKCNKHHAKPFKEHCWELETTKDKGKEGWKSQLWWGVGSQFKEEQNVRFDKNKLMIDQLHTHANSAAQYPLPTQVKDGEIKTNKIPSIVVD